ncbi:MarR family winged helix-turn-helix transcriptional regulator [Spirochaeta isovalerica]|uniref:DNA-binding MarR family transcriptional regulator n=1 Tax=Spirochaeta isovalerica TaxID=150 RepID=A0A841R9J6_9SPIO|nr:winged helix DNA-binding protein [Spirochaeta isovalerica]MBB6479680.1 DNA-binding MarR family transcriptional regulator [Spirochaeta isovalerica]
MSEKTESPEGILDLISRIRDTSGEILSRELEMNGIEGVVPAHGKIIFHLFQKEKPVPLSEVVKASGRVKSTITGMVATLEKHGYLMRTHSPEDKRSVLVELTPKGRAMRELFNDISIRILDRIYMGIDRPEQEALTDSLSRINRNLKDALALYIAKENIK